MIHVLFDNSARLAVIFLLTFSATSCSLPEPPQKSKTIPADYAEKHMPEGWWTDEQIIDTGRRIYLGIENPGVNCANCHGKSGKPLRSGAPDFRDPPTMKKYSDSHLLWRISEGVSFTSMSGHKSKLSEDQIWKVIAFISTLGLAGLQYDPSSGTWVLSE